MEKIWEWFCDINWSKKKKTKTTDSSIKKKTEWWTDDVQVILVSRNTNASRKWIWSLVSYHKKTRVRYVQAAEMRMLRPIREVTKCDKVRNEKIRKSLNVESILSLVEKRQDWSGLGMSREWKAHDTQENICRGVPEGRRLTGRPRRRWMEGVRELGVREEGRVRRKLRHLKRSHIEVDGEDWLEATSDSEKDAK